jgi:hypothetical protein
VQLADCVHFWRVEEAHGATSLGTCKYCHEQRPFNNSTPDVDFKVASRVTRAKDTRKDDGDYYKNGGTGWTR